MIRSHRALAIGLDDSGGGGAFDPIDTLGTRLIAMAWAPWEGGNAPANASARAQNPSITTGSTISTITEWSGNSAHFVNVFGAGATWTTGQMNGNPAFVCVSQSYSQTSQDALNDNMTIVCVYENSASATGYLYQGGVASNPQLLARNTGTIEWYDSAGNTSTTLGADAHIITRHISSDDTISRLDGAVIDSEGSVYDYTTNYIGRWLSSKTGSFRLGGDVMGWFMITDITDGELASLEAWCAVASGVTLSGP